MSSDANRTEGLTITLRTHDGREMPARQPYANAPYAVVAGHQCECSRDLDLEVAGGRTTEYDDGRRVEARAGCVRCHGSVGTLVVAISSLFGPEEDFRVLYGRPRVY